MKKYEGYVGVIDSGVGGLDILNSLRDHFKDESFVFIGDNLNNPYGEKSKEELEEIGLCLGNYLQEQGVKVIVIACNTLTIAGLEVMSKNLKIPVYGIIDRTAQYYVSQNHLRPLVLATKYTVEHDAYLNSIHKYNKDIIVTQEAAGDLVLIIENADFADLEDVLHNHIDPYVSSIDSMVLGCTHFPIVQESINKLYPNIPIYNSRQAMVDLLEEELSNNHLEADSQAKQHIVVYATGSKDALYNASKQFFDYKDVVLKEGLD